MGKHIGLGRLFLLFLLFTTSQVLALSCDAISTQNKQICQNILNSEVSLIEKEALITNLEYANPYSPDHTYIFLRNSNIQFQNPPDNIRTSDSIFIKNAWVSIFGVMPSVIYNKTLLCPSKTKVLTGFNYQISLPSEYHSSGYPSTSAGDCRRTYTLVGNSAENRIFVNGVYQGSGSLVDVQIPFSTTINAHYRITSQARVEHYEWDKYCCRTRRGKCIQYCYNCKFSNSEVQTDNLLLHDTLPVKLYSNTLTGTMQVTDKYESTTRFQTNFSNAIEILFNNSAYNFYDYTYTVNYSKLPYYFATLQATGYRQEKLSNVLKEGNGFVVKNIQGCKIHAFDFFTILDTNCDLAYDESPFSLKTDLFYYKIGDSINVSLIPLANYNVSYGNQTSVGSNVTFNAESGTNKIHADLNGISQEHFIFVYDQSKISLVIKIILFFLLIYIFYKVMKKIVRRFV